MPVKTKLPPGSKLEEVRCLGRGPEHSFLSTNKKSHRLCPRCRSLNDREPMAAREVPTRFGNGLRLTE